ncbi:preprotein translocase subunit SecG [Mangrovimicrobium sediminis]|uniref:Protein-export membrane protein SecG n=1 Tax=Mangrovimicrobium sediminis TaxID=2562682 RepID=A0A4Z0LUS7_9GAMM|nr:preprotein translocase subunit SecG [Haliea sp. SAOS-164]TGD70957.1 preprotein translocase subunit SecG [Haliea sp. SAOS-164]
MLQIILVVHLIVALGIIGLIMLQQGKGADIGASFGAGASQTLFGASGSGNALTRATAWLVAVFFATSFGLAVLATQQSDTVNDLGIEIPAAQEQAAAPAVTGEEVPSVESDIPTASSTDADLPSGDVPVVEEN